VYPVAREHGGPAFSVFAIETRARPTTDRADTSHATRGPSPRLDRSTGSSIEAFDALSRGARERSSGGVRVDTPDPTRDVVRMWDRKGKDKVASPSVSTWSRKRSAKWRSRARGLLQTASHDCTAAHNPRAWDTVDLSYACVCALAAPREAWASSRPPRIHKSRRRRASVLRAAARGARRQPHACTSCSRARRRAGAAVHHR
jgi:hypothetical protein